MSYSPTSIYDTPVVLASMLIDREFTARGGMNALVNPASLSPAELDTINTRVKQSMGNTGVGNAIVDIALNPWTWMFFATSTPGTVALGEAGRGLFSVSKPYLNNVVENSSWLKSLGGWSGWQLLRGTTTPDALFQVGQEQERMIAHGAGFQKPLADWMAKHGLETLDHTKIVDPAKAELAGRAATLLNTSLSGRFADRVRQVVTGAEVKDGHIHLKMESGVSGAWIKEPDKLEALLKDEGLVEARDALRSFYQERWGQLFGSRESTLRVYRGMRNPLIKFDADKGSVEQGRNIIGQLVGADVADKIASGEISQSSFEALIDNIRNLTNDGTYLPRNNYRIVGESTIKSTQQSRSNAFALGATMSAAPRSKVDLVHDEADLDMALRVFGNDATDALRSEREVARSQAASAIEEGRALRMLRIDPLETTRRYNNETARTYAWHVANPNDTVRARMADEYTRLRDGKIHLPAGFETTYHGGKASLNEHIGSIAEKDAPLGGFSLADVAHSAWAVNPDQYAKDAITRVLIPAVSGKYGVKHTATAAALNQGRMWLNTLVESPIGKAIAGAGKPGSRFMQTLKNAANPEDPLSGGGTFSHAAAKFLYVTHLGFSVPSMMLNITQPMTLAATWVGVDNTLKGYAKASKEMLGYIEDRIRTHGVGPIGNAERAKLAAKHFEDAHLLGIGPSMLEQLDSKIFTTGTPYRPNSAFDTFTHYAMAGFTASEWMNRAVTGHALKSAYQKAGRSLAEPLFKSDLVQFVNETQFAAHPLNTPLMFMSADPELVGTGRVLTNPLARQFLTFPFRSAMSYWKVGPGLAERGGGWVPRLNDFARGMAISNVLYQAGKNLAGIDLSRSGTFATATDILPGVSSGRYDQREGALPVPPILDIPFNVVKALATEDRMLLANNLARTIPAGIAISRALGVAPQVPSPFSGIQKTYADWGNRTMDGKVPVYSQDGKLINAEGAGSLILRGLGADLGKYKSEQDLDGFLVKNTSEMQQYRGQYVTALLNSNTNQAAQVKEEFEKRFKIPLTVSKAQIRSAQQVRNTPRADRILKTMPPTARPVYAAMVQQQRGEGVPPPAQEQQNGFDPFQPYTGYSR